MPDKKYEILSANDPSLDPGNAQALLEYDLALVVDSSDASAITACMVEFDGDGIADLSRSIMPNRNAIYVTAVYGQQLHDAPLKVARGGVVRAFTFGAKVHKWLAENRDVREAFMRKQIQALGTDIARMMKEALKQQRGL